MLAGGRTDRQTDTVITILRLPCRGRSNNIICPYCTVTGDYNGTLNSHFRPLNSLMRCVLAANLYRNVLGPHRMNPVPN